MVLGYVDLWFVSYYCLNYEFTLLAMVTVDAKKKIQKENLRRIMMNIKERLQSGQDRRFYETRTLLVLKRGFTQK